MSLTKAPNINYLWSTLIIEELVRNGVDHFCISPGSRSSPLTTAVALNKKTSSHIHFDERGNAFYALGYASATKKPVAVITTSGTAVANLFPAVIEASKKKLPLIILTADRPPELRHTGANQTIDQVKIFSDYVRWQFDLPTPSKDIAPEFVLTTIDQALHRSKGEWPGPVHINCMFREPLAPMKTREKFKSLLTGINSWKNNNTVYTKYTSPNKNIELTDMRDVAKKIKKIKQGLIVAGKLSNTSEQEAVLKLAKKLHWPIFPDISSGLRLGRKDKHVISYFDQILLSDKTLPKIDGVLHLGGRITSKRWSQFIEKNRPKQTIMVLNHPLRNDPLHSVTTRIQLNIETFCSETLKQVSQRKASSTINRLNAFSEKIETILEDTFAKERKLSEPAVVRQISKLIPRNEGLFLASSLPVREMDMYASPNGQYIQIGSNRGASGIDGTIATASGFSEGMNKRVTAVIGDLAFLYDLNSLAMVSHLTHPMIIIVLNNNGGGIFNFLPIADFKNVFEKYFATPHDLSFYHAGKLFDLSYIMPKTNNDFKDVYLKALRGRKSTIIEVKADRVHNVRYALQIQNSIKRRLKRNK